MTSEPTSNDTLARARAALSASPLPGLRGLSVELVESELLISGAVNSFYQKQLAQELVRAIAGVVPIRNQIFVHYDDVRLADE